jgi:Protein of unknown function (DUF2911)
MKKNVLFMLGLLLFGTLAMAQNAPKSPAATSESAHVKVSYGQPSKNGREIFGKLVPMGEVWRTGANAGTEVTFTKDVNFAGKAVKAGTYTLFTIPNAAEWTVILNAELKQWGAYGYDKIKSKNVAEVKVPANSSNAMVEKLSITAEDSQITIAWDTTVVKVPLTW